MSQSAKEASSRSDRSRRGAINALLQVFAPPAIGFNEARLILFGASVPFRFEKDRDAKQRASRRKRSSLEKKAFPAARIIIAGNDIENVESGLAAQRV